MHNSNHLEQVKIILIGASAGGPGHIQKIINSLPSDFSAAVIIAQHIGDDFIPSFVNQLKQNCEIEIEAVSDEVEVNPGKVYICSRVTEFKLSNQRPLLGQIESKQARYNPDIDILFASASILIPYHSIMSIILTGVGDDGTKGSQVLSIAGATCIAESEVSAVVYGMPMQAKLSVDNILVQSLDQIIQSMVVFGR
jgi:two-component system chemotaxis response regulator CheB